MKVTMNTFTRSTAIEDGGFCKFIGRAGRILNNKTVREDGLRQRLHG